VTEAATTTTTGTTPASPNTAGETPEQIVVTAPVHVSPASDAPVVEQPDLSSLTVVSGGPCTGSSIGSTRELALCVLSWLFLFTVV